MLVPRRPRPGFREMFCQIWARSTTKKYTKFGWETNEIWATLPRKGEARRGGGGGGRGARGGRAGAGGGGARGEGRGGVGTTRADLAGEL